VEHDLVSEWVDIAVDEGGGSSVMPAYLARPAAPGAYPSVVVGFEMFGVTGYIRSVADRIARLGYTTVVPDFYHRLGERIELVADADGRARGLELLQGVHREGVVRDVRSALDHLRDRADADARTAMVGLSVGGHIAYYAATQIALDAVVVFYPGWLTDTCIALSRPEPTLTLTSAIADYGSRVLFLVGADDHLFTPEQRDQIGRHLRDADVRHELVVYPDTPHGFLCHERDTYRPPVAEDAWARVTTLLAAELAPTS
jgi:carboxymethylenebutenolidase